jgi:hypothetical protein
MESMTIRRDQGVPNGVQQPPPQQGMAPNDPQGQMGGPLLAGNSPGGQIQQQAPPQQQQQQEGKSPNQQYYQAPPNDNQFVDMSGVGNYLKNITRATDDVGGPREQAGIQLQGRRNVDVSVSGVMTAFKLNTALFIFFIFLYELFRRVAPSVYETKRRPRVRDPKAAGERTPSGHLYDEASDDEGKYSRLESLPAGFLPLSWIPTVYRVPWSRVLEVGGLDAYCYLRYIRMCFRIVAVSGFWSLVFLFPIYATGTSSLSGEGWYLFSMAHVAQGSWRLWFPAFFCWLLVSAYRAVGKIL